MKQHLTEIKKLQKLAGILKESQLNKEYQFNFHFNRKDTINSELDIYIPSIKLAIEYDGEAWHKNNTIKREERKYQLCKENGIKLIRLSIMGIGFLLILIALIT